MIAPLAGALGDRIGLRVVIVAGLLLQAAGFAAVALAASAGRATRRVVVALLVAGVGVSMTLPTVPAMALGAADPADMGTASGVNTMLQRLGQVFGVAVVSAVFTAFGHLGSPASITSGFRPALAVAATFSLLGAVAALAIAGPRRQPARARLDAWPRN